MEELGHLAFIWGSVYLASIFAVKTKLTPVLYFLAFVVLDIAYVEHQILSVDAFYTLMITAFLLNVTVPLSIRWWKPHYKKARLARAG